MSPEELKSYIDAMKASDIPTAQRGLWKITRVKLNSPVVAPRHGEKIILDAGIYTQLFRYTTAQPFDIGPGECVMEDSLYELRTHFEFVFRAFGDVLITGLGLGCVARGVRKNPRVKSVTVIERDEDILQMVAPSMPPGIEIIHAEAESWVKSCERKFDTIWHDLWTDEDSGEPNLHVKHMTMLCESHRIANAFQGAWEFPRMFRKRMPNVI